MRDAVTTLQRIMSQLLSGRCVFLLVFCGFLSVSIQSRAQCPDTGQTKVFNSKQGAGYYFYRFVGDGSFRYFLAGKTFSYNDKDDPGKTFAFIDDMAYELILEDKADFTSYIKGAKPIDLLRAQAQYEQDVYKKRFPSVVIKDYGPPANYDPNSNDRLFYLWRKDSPPGMEVATQFLVSTLVKDKVVLLSIMLTQPSASEKGAFLQIEKYTGSFALLTANECAEALSAPVVH